MNIFTYLRLSAIVLCSLLFTPSYALEEKDYFITVWDLSKGTDNTTIGFRFFSYDYVVTYSWETIPADRSGSGMLSAGYTYFRLENLPANAKIKLKFSPENIKSLSISSSKLIDVQQWGTVFWQSMESAFEQSENLNITATDAPLLYRVERMNKMFKNCKNLTGPTNINEWNIQNVKNVAPEHIKTTIEQIKFFQELN